MDALYRIFRYGKELASAGAVVDAIDAAAVAFYVKYGFLELPKVPSPTICATRRRSSCTTPRQGVGTGDACLSAECANARSNRPRTTCARPPTPSTSSTTNRRTTGGRSAGK